MAIINYSEIVRVAHAAACADAEQRLPIFIDSRFLATGLALAESAGEQNLLSTKQLTAIAFSQQ